MCSSQSEDYDMQKKKNIILHLTPMFMVMLILISFSRAIFVRAVEVFCEP